MQSTRLYGVLVILAHSLSLGCGSSTGKAGEAVRPKAATASEALGESECRDSTGKPGEPLIVDWKSDQRDDLEIAMRDKIAVVSFSCKEIKVLTDCYIEGKYGFLGTTRKEQVVQLQNADEVSVNLPLSFAKIGSDIARGSTIDIAMVTVGKKRTTWDKATAAELKGSSCKGATHFVRGASVGAFAIGTGTEGKVRAAAEMFGMGASGKSASTEKIGNKQGDPADCATATPDSEKPPSQCGSPIRLVLFPIVAGADKSSPPPSSPAQKEKEEDKPKSDEGQGCPSGHVFANGKCTKPAANVAYICKAGDVGDCATQCDKGNAASCGELGIAQMRLGSGGSIPNNKANQDAFVALKKGCDGDSALACGTLGTFYLAGVGTKRDPSTAAKLYEKGCIGGDARGCRGLGFVYNATDADQAGLKRDESKAASLFRQACDGGDRVGCAFLGHMYLKGTGVPKDAAKGLGYKQRACDGGFAPACTGVGEMYETGKDVGKNPILAEEAYRRGCLLGTIDFATSCTGLGRVQFTKNDPGAKANLERGCAFGDDHACAIQKFAFGTTRPAIAKPADINAAMKDCNGGDARACTEWGLLQSLQTPAVGKPTVQRGCTMGDAFGCAILKKMP